jgi:high-affinity Fe2+/Pb2+ permease
MSFGTADIVPLILIVVIAAIFVGILFSIRRPHLRQKIFWVLLGLGLVIIIGRLVMCGSMLFGSR